MPVHEYEPRNIDPGCITELLDGVLGPTLNESGTPITDLGIAADMAHYLSPDTFPSAYPGGVLDADTWGNYLRDRDYVDKRIQTDKQKWDDWQQKLSNSLGRRVLSKFLGSAYGYQGLPLDLLQDAPRSPRVSLPTPLVLFSRYKEIDGHVVSKLMPVSGIEYFGRLAIRQEALQGIIVLDEVEHVFDINNPGYGLTLSMNWYYDRDETSRSTHYFPTRNRFDVQDSRNGESTSYPIELAPLDGSLSPEENMQRVLEIAKQVTRAERGQ